MNMVFPKNRGKRTRTTSNETNTSFVRNVTSRVSGLLPATITKWFSSPSSSNTNGSAPTAEATDSSTEDEAPENTVITQPPSKRMRFNTTNKFSRYGPVNINCSTSNIEITEIPPNPYPGTQFPNNRNNLNITPMHSPNETVTSDSVKNISDRETSRFTATQHTVNSIGQSVAKKRKSIFDRSNESVSKTEKQKSAEKKPSFKHSMVGSPFYRGSTMYGGAASSYINQPNIQQHTVALVKETKSNEDSVMSTSTRRIMDLLEAYSSPLVEARRIPQYTRPKFDSFNTSERSTPISNRSLSYRQELHVPSIASILRLRQRSRLMDGTNTARQIIASHSSACNYPMPYPTSMSKSTNTTETMQTKQSSDEIDMGQSKMTTKLKARVARTNRGNQDQIDLVTPVKLPTGTLQIDNNKLPKFSFDSPVASKLPATSTPIIDKFSAPKSAKLNKTDVASVPERVSHIYKFSSPVRISSENSEPNTTPPKFTFESPERQIDQNSHAKSDVAPVVPEVKEISKMISKPKGWQCPECWVNNKPDIAKCVCCGYKQTNNKSDVASATKEKDTSKSNAFSGSKEDLKESKCSKCKLAACPTDKDICVNCEKIENPFTVKSSTSKWKCDACWVMNDDKAVKCACCGGNKPNDASKAAKAAMDAEIAAIPIPPARTCGGFTVNSSPNPMKSFTLPVRPLVIASDDKLINMAKAQKSAKWECFSCLVRNDSDKSACVCCGAEKEPKPKLPTDVKFNFGKNTNTSFKFGIDPKVQEASIAKVPEVTPTSQSKWKDQSETNNNVLAETPTFTFTLPTKKTEPKTDTLKAKAEEPAKFSFGIPKDSSATVNKEKSAKLLDEDNEKPQEVPEVNLSTAKQEQPKTIGLFNSPLSQTNKATPAVPTTAMFSVPSVEEKTADTLNKPVNLQPEATNEKAPQPTPIVFGSIKPASNLFNTPAATSSSANPFTAPPLSTAAATMAPTLSLVPTTSLMQKTETSSATTLKPNVPLFSFGSNNTSNPLLTSSAASTAPPAEKPQFQFTFGANNPPKTDAMPALMTAPNTAVFKSPFASIGDGNANNTNSFNLNAENAMDSNNGINTTNGLETNTLGNNTLRLGNNALGSNTLGSTLGNNPLGVNTIGGANTLSGNPMGGTTLPGTGMTGNLLSGNTMPVNSFTANSMTTDNNGTTNMLGGTNGLAGNTLASGNGLQPSNPLTSGAPNIFGNTVQKENMWNSNQNAAPTNMFATNTSTNNMQKPPAFSFGTSTPFNATAPPPAFGSNTQPAQNIFGMAQNNNNSQPSPFSNPVQNQNSGIMFGTPQQVNNPAPQIGMFGSQSMGAAPPFGSPNPSMPTFEAQPMAPNHPPAFNFGAPSQTPGVFGFGQQPQQQQTQQAGVYNFGQPNTGAPQVQFNMGAAPAGRRLRKAIRRTTPR